MKRFEPEHVVVEQDALDYELGRRLYGRFAGSGVPVEVSKGFYRAPRVPGDSPREAYRRAKKTLVVGVRRSLRFEGCRPSADYQLPLASSCPGLCEYCYLQTTLGPVPYVRVYANEDEILEAARGYALRTPGRIVSFEGGATSDPVAVEHITGGLRRTMEFFGRIPNARLRVVTKFSSVDDLLHASHRGHTRLRFSVNPPGLVGRFEAGTAPLGERLDAARRVRDAGCPLGLMVAPIMVYDGWERDYEGLFRTMADALQMPGIGMDVPPSCPASVPHEDHAGPPERLQMLGDGLGLAGAVERPVDYGFAPARGVAPAVGPITFEFVTHRFTARAKNLILERFPHTRLDLDESKRKFRFGQFGYGKYVYPPAELHRIEDLMHNLVDRFFPGAPVEYLV